MRVRSLVILLAIVGVTGYLVFFQWNWLVTLFTKGRQFASGYTPAKTPEDAMDQFARAIKERDYESAALYCAGEYADYLRKAHTAASTIGARVDQLQSITESRGFNSDTATLILRCLDPFPGDFKRPSGKDLVKLDDKRMSGWFEAPPLTLQAEINDVRGLDLRLFRNALMPPMKNEAPVFNYRVEIVAEGDGDARVWKLNIPLDNRTRDEIDHLIRNYRKYENALDSLIISARASGSYSSPREFQKHLIEVLSDQN